MKIFKRICIAFFPLLVISNFLICCLSDRFDSSSIEHFFMSILNGFCIAGEEAFTGNSISECIGYAIGFGCLFFCIVAATVWAAQILIDYKKE